MLTPTRMNDVREAIAVMLANVRDPLLELERRATEAGDAVPAAVRERWIEAAPNDV